MLFPQPMKEKNMGISVKPFAPAITINGSLFSFNITDDNDCKWFLSITQQVGDGVHDWHFYLQSPTGHEWDLKTDRFPKTDGSCGFDLDSAWDVLMLMGILKHDGVPRKTAA
tara:strand:- start:671 stop:1006 length:336 start_codon:yes stop_codon:yes gene_type:complete